MNNLDEKDLYYVKAALELRSAKTVPLVGDFVKMPDGKIERFSHDWGDRLQTCEGGSFYLNASGRAGFSGALNPSIPVSQIMAIPEQMEGNFWTFHHDYAEAHNDVYFKIPCKVWCYNPVTEITEEKFHEMLEVLPPDNWNMFKGVEYFQMCERYDFDRTSYYVKILDKYYMFLGKPWMKGNEVFDYLVEAIK